MPILFFDTETTGKQNRKAPSSDPSQPDLVQMAAILTDDQLNEIASINSIVFPSNWVIGEVVAAIHGISHSKAEKYGAALSTVMGMFLDFADIADRFVIHNSEYDVCIVERAIARLKLPDKPFEGKEVRCTMKAATPILKIPKSNSYLPGPYKFAKLEETVRYFFDEEMIGAHDALNDVRYTIRVYRELCLRHGMTP